MESLRWRPQISFAPFTTTCGTWASTCWTSSICALMGRGHEPSEGSIEEPFTALAELQRQGLIRHLGVSNVTSAQVAQARSIAEIVCVQNLYNLVHRADDALIEELADIGIAYVPFFPLGGFTPLQSSTLSNVAAELGATPMQVALAWLLHRAPNILLIPGTSSIAHLHENLAAAELALPDEALARLEAIDGIDRSIFDIRRGEPLPA